MFKTGTKCILLYVFCSGFFMQVSLASQQNHPDELHPAIAIIIDDIGYRFTDGHAALALPGMITYAFLPYAPHARQLAEQAHTQGKQVMLHVPMEADNGKHMGPGGLSADMERMTFFDTFRQGVKSIPHVSGFNNHMGSRMTRNDEIMNRLMGAVAVQGNLFFVDSKTTGSSVAYRYARKYGVPSIERDVFIDHEDDENFIRKQLKLLVRTAHQNGTALGIAHPKPVTLTVLQHWLPVLHEQGIKLVSVSELINIQQQRRLAYDKSARPLSAGL